MHLHAPTLTCLKHACSLAVTAALVTPFEVGFLSASTTVDSWFIINRVVDVVFIIDMAFQFCVVCAFTTRLLSPHTHAPRVPPPARCELALAAERAIAVPRCNPRFQLAATLASPRFASTFCRSIRRPPRKETSTTPSSSLSAAKVSALNYTHGAILPSYPCHDTIPTLCRHCVATHAQSCAITSSVGSHWTSSPSSHRSLTSSLLSKRATLPTNPSTL